MDDDIAPGWDAITAACTALHGDAEPMHWGTVMRWTMGGNDPLDGVSAHDAGDHWHYVSYGLTELYQKESEHLEFSGFGFELSFRLKKTGDEAPVWPVNLFQNLARYVFQTGNVLSDGDYMPFNGPICADEPTVLTGGLFVADRDLPTLDTPHGTVEFRELLAVTDAEIAAAQRWNTHGIAGLLRARGSDVADIDRACWTLDEAFAEQVREGAEGEGSRTGLTYVSSLTTRVTGDIWEVEIGAIAARTLIEMLPARIPFDMPYVMTSDDQTLAFHPGETHGIESREGGLVLTLSAETAKKLSTSLRAERGTYGVEELPILFQVQRTEIRNKDGEITEVVG